jgi:hypothetical protein
MVGIQNHCGGSRLGLSARNDGRFTLSVGIHSYRIEQPGVSTGSAHTLGAALEMGRVKTIPRHGGNPNEGRQL